MAILRQSSLSTMRMNAARLNYHNQVGYVTIAGTRREDNIRRNPDQGYQLEFHEYVNSTPNTATMRVWGFTPTFGQEVKIYFGAPTLTELKFGGTIQKVTQVYEGNQNNVAYDVDLIDYSQLLDKMLVFKSYVNVSATAVAQDIISSFTSGFTSTKVQALLPSITITFLGVPVSQALLQICQLIGGHYKVDYTKDLRLVTTSTIGLPDPATVTNANALNDNPLAQVTDGSQVRTRVYVIGKGTTAIGTIASGSAVLPVVDITLFSSGTAVVGGQRISYTGVIASSGSIVGVPLVPTTAPSFSSSGAGSSTAGYITWAVTFVTASGETTIGPRMNPVIHTVGGQSTTIASIPVGPSGTTARRIYRCSSQPGASDPFTAALKLSTTLNDNSTTLYTDPCDDSSLGGGPPGTDTSRLVDTAQRVALGSTSLALISTAAFSSTGGWAIAGSVPAFSYTGKTSTTLTGIPASGTGSITGDINYGTTCVTAPLLTGIPTSGAGSIAATVNVGDAVRPYVQRDDATAQATLAATGFGDGIVEDKIDDNTMVTTAQMNAAGDAVLTLFKTVEVQLNPFASVDYKLVPGATVPAAIGAPTNINGSFLIQSVDVTRISMPGTADNNGVIPFVYPLRTAHAGTTRFTLQELLRQLSYK